MVIAALDLAKKAPTVITSCMIIPSAVITPCNMPPTNDVYRAYKNGSQMRECVECNNAFTA
jgi:hypothetical protein